MVTTWLPHGYQIITTWLPDNYHMVTMVTTWISWLPWLPHEYHGYHMVTTWLPHDYHMVTIHLIKHPPKIHWGETPLHTSVKCRLSLFTQQKHTQEKTLEMNNKVVSHGKNEVTTWLPWLPHGYQVRVVTTWLPHGYHSRFYLDINIS